MEDTARIIRGLRSGSGLSQRKFARLAGLSFRQVQRLEKGESDITLGKFNALLDGLDLAMTVTAREPDWNALCYMGMPLSAFRAGKRRYGPRVVGRNLALALRFLPGKSGDARFQRHYDAFRVMLLAILGHYPTRFRRLESEQGMDIASEFRLRDVTGRMIKLRNICLPRLSGYFKNN